MSIIWPVIASGADYLHITNTRAAMLLGTIFLTILTVSTVRAESLFQFADEISTEGIKECRAKGLGE